MADHWASTMMNISGVTSIRATVSLRVESKRQEGFDALKYAGALKSVEAALELVPKI